MKTVSKLICTCLIPSIIVLLFTESQFANADDEPDLSGSPRFHAAQVSGGEAYCEHRRQEGTCRRRSQCNRPTRTICRFGLNPVVCCLDRMTTTTPPTKPPRPPLTTKRLVTTRRPSPKPEDIKEVDLAFPGCGLRSPGVEPTRSREASRGREASGSEEPEKQPSGRRRGGILSRLGKREAILRINKRQIRPVIVGGQTASPNSWPWMVAVFKQSVSGGPKRFLCGASLISRRYVLCAAHCFDAEKGNIVPSKFTIVVGSHTTKDGTQYPLENILIHPEYRAPQYYNDISLLKLKMQAGLNKKVYPVCLPSESLRNKIKPDQKDVTVTGWGDTTFGGVASKLLQEVTMPIVPLKECNASYSKVAKSNFPRGISTEFMCAGFKEGGKDACQGDSGGPMVMKLGDSDTYVQLGVVSFGYGCAKAGYPGVYTRVSKYAKWIYDNTDFGLKP